MTPWAYYNEIDAHAAQTLRNLMAAGHIAPGYVDERSIVDVRPYDLRDFAQCHFFAGVGVWSYALRRSGWSDGRRVWSGSCPCQPFSTAGQGGGFDDERHLWPSWYHLIEQLEPPVVIGEQVASKDVDPWVDLVQDDLEGMGYAFAAVPFPAASVGAPHIRDRCYWVAHGGGARLEEQREQLAWGERSAAERGREARELAHDDRDGQRALARTELHNTEHHAQPRGGVDVLEHAVHGTLNGVNRRRPAFGLAHANATRGFWADAEWIACRDGKARPVEPGTFPLAHGAPARVGRLRAYGNAIVAPQAQVFIECVMECLP